MFHLVILFFISMSLNYYTIAHELEVFQQKAIVNSSHLTVLTLTPSLFNWNSNIEIGKEIEYSARIAHCPDLPSWLSYTYERSNSTGYLYGVPPSSLDSIDIDVVGLNTNNLHYEVKRLIISIGIVAKVEYPFVAEFKIDNLNPKDLCDPWRMKKLVTIFSEFLNWRKLDGSSPTPVFLASANEQQEHHSPLRPQQFEGVIVHLGSDKNFSSQMFKLYSQVAPLWKLRPCPRDLKRTSMEKYFREQRFLIDWCSFTLKTQNKTEHVLGQEEKNTGIENVIGHNDNEFGENGGENQGEKEDIFTFVKRDELPERHYGTSILIATLIPGSIGGLLGILLVGILWTDTDENQPVKNKNVKNGRMKKRYNSEGSYEQFQQPPAEDDFFILTGDKVRHEPQNMRERTPLPPQYPTATHPNGSPALTYAV